MTINYFSRPEDRTIADLASLLDVLETDADAISNWPLGLRIGWLGSFPFSHSATVVANWPNWFSSFRIAWCLTMRLFVLTKWNFELYPLKTVFFVGVQQIKT